MLQLQRASAGSGKTYTLAKKFIWFLIAVKEDGKPWRLRRRREIADGLPAILAITFTNKATNEMKQRIVEKLADLARAAAMPPLSAEEISKTAYLSEFAADLNVDVAEVGKACGTALSELLNNYSDFRVSTIDSFFQSVLRTFAYESNLSDSYQVEIDSDYLASASIDATLDEVNRDASHSSAASRWLRILMEEASDSGSQWNVFQKSGSRQSIYSRLRKTVTKIESEEFKEIRESLDGYFNSDNGDRLLEAYLALRGKIETPLKEALAAAIAAAGRLQAELRRQGVDPAADCRRYLDSHLIKVRRLAFNESDSSRNIFSPLEISDKKPLLKKGASAPDAARLQEIAMEMYAQYSLWLQLRSSKEWLHWQVYAPLLPYLGLLGEARRKMLEFLDANNLIQLGETNSMLKRIIGDDDAPFIYERLGSIIDHYLIDEFQDTSSMQWDNLRPLLMENDSRGKDNLIIGDAKQSIYRFRNADPSLITTTVPSEFPGHRLAGMSKEENTNWRSDRNIVEFNNFFFHALTRRLQKLTKGGIDFPRLYGNVAQFPSHRAENGYVEVRFLSAEPTEEEKAAGITEKDLVKGMALDALGPLVASLMQRGYRQREIAILVDTNQDGKDAIASLVAYNATLPEGTPKIGFISEESLLVSSAEAVGIIVAVLRQIAEGSDSKALDFSLYAMRHPEMSPAEQVAGFMAEGSGRGAVAEMLADMQAVVLPALVEAVTEKFVPRELRREQAVFIAAFQDMALDFSSRQSSDIASFLFWWDSKGKERSISSPEDTDAVQIMTVHKAKGLEFRCVIMPLALSSMLPMQKAEWRWVEPSSCMAGAGLPPFVPVETRSSLENTDHAEAFRKYHDLFMMDRLNSTYVAFTRAVSELYVFTRAPKRTGEIGGFLKEILSDPETALEAVESEQDRSFMTLGGKVVWNEREDVASVGSLPNSEAIAAGRKTSSKGSKEFVIPEYGVDSTPAILHYIEKDTTDSSTVAPQAEETDPRSEGSLLHAVMERVRTAADLHRAVLHLRMRGLITSAMARDWEEMLSKAIAAPEVRKWFEPRWKVVNERDIILPKSKNRRPDRVMFSPDGKSAVIVDYKFGAIPEGDSHIRQVKDYAQLLREATGIGGVSAFVWYVKAGKVVRAL